MWACIYRGFHRLYGKISANRFDRYKNDVFPLLDVLNSHTTEQWYARQIEIKNLSAFFYCHQKGENRYATKRISQTAQGSVRHQDGRQRMAGGVLGRHPPLPNKIQRSISKQLKNNYSRKKKTQRFLFEKAGDNKDIFISTVLIVEAIRYFLSGVRTFLWDYIAIWFSSIFLEQFLYLTQFYVML